MKKFKNRIICVLFLCFFIAVLCGAAMQIPVLRITSPSAELLFYAKPGDELQISSFHSLYHVTQTETWTVLNDQQLQLNQMYFGCYEAGEYYSTYFMENYKPFSGAGDYYLEVHDIIQKEIVLIITPTSQFRIQLHDRVHLLYQKLHGFSTFRFDHISLFDYLAYHLS